MILKGLENIIKRTKYIFETKFNNNDKRAKIQDSDFIIGLLAAVTHLTEKFSLSILRLSVCKILEQTIEQSAFNERLRTPSLVKQMKIVLEGLIQQRFAARNTTGEADQIAKLLGVTSIVGIDGSMVSLWDGLAEHFAGTFTTAALKLHLAIELTTGQVTWYDLTSGSTHDSQRFPNLFEGGTLYIMDLGYWDVSRLREIELKKCCYLSRLKANHKITILKAKRGNFKKDIVGCNLNSLTFERSRGDIVELEGHLNDSTEGLKVRVVGFWHPEEKNYKWYVTNLTSPIGIIATLYKLRWQIELSFKALKSHFQFDRIPTLSQNTAMVLATVALCHYIMSSSLREVQFEPQEKEKSQPDRESPKDRTCKETTKTSSPSKRSLSILRASPIMCLFSVDIYSLMRVNTRITKKKMCDLSKQILSLIRTNLDPNYQKRKTTISELQMCA